MSKFLEPEKFRIAKKPFGFEPDLKEIVSFRYKKFNELNKEELSFPIDKYVLGLLKQEYKI